MGAEHSRSFDKFAGVAAVLAAGMNVLYSAFFVLTLRGNSDTAVPSAVLLMASGLLGLVVVCALFRLYDNLDSGFALLGLLLGALGAGGAFIHGAFDLATLVGPSPGEGAAVNAIDPRGVLTFGATALSILIFSRLIILGTRLPLQLGWVGQALGLLLILVYLGRLLVLDPSQPVIRTSAILTGFLLSPLWNLWIGVELIRGD